MTYLILRSQYNHSVIEQASVLRSRLWSTFNEPPKNVVVPTIIVERRMGRDRRRVEVEVPVLGNFLFCKWKGEVRYAQWIENQCPFLTIMRLPQGGYAACPDDDVEQINKLPPLPVQPDSATLAPLVAGQRVVCVLGWLRGLQGVVTRYRADGVAYVKVEPAESEKRGLRLTTLQLHSSLLQIAPMPQ